MSTVPAVKTLRGQELRHLLRTRSSIGLLIAFGVLALVGREAGDRGRIEGLAALAIGVGGAVMVLWTAWNRADARAQRRWMALWGEPHGLRPADEPRAARKATPLLREGSSRRVLNAVAGTIASDPAATVAHYSYDEQQGRNRVPHPFTICLLRLPGTAEALPLLTLRPRGRTGGLLDGWTGAVSSSRVVELESARLHGAFRLVVDDHQDEVALRRVLTPAFMVWLEGLEGSGLRFELERGWLVVALPTRSFDAERLDWLLAAGGEIARRLAA